MILKRAILLVLILACIQPSIRAQSMRQNKDVFPMFGDFKRQGWLVAPGITYTIGNFKNRTKVFNYPSDSAYSINFIPSGKYGLCMDVGRFYAPKNAGLIKLIDFAVSFKLLRGKELFTAKAIGNTFETTGVNVFTEGFVSGTVHFNNLKQLNDNSFSLNGIGLNVDYNLINNTTKDYNGLQITTSKPNTLITQLNYQIGYGIKVRNNLLIIPTLETPILNIWDFENGKSTLSYFNSRYRPILLKIKFLLIDSKTDIKCPKSKSKKEKSKRSKDDPLWGNRKSSR